MLLVAVSACHGDSHARKPNLERVRKLLSKYRLDEAREALEPLIAVGVAGAEAYLLAGRIYEEMGDGPAARRYFDRAVAVEPGNAEAHSYLARSLLGAKDYEEARRHLRTALKLGQDQALPYAMGALYYLQKGNHDMSQKYVDKAVAIEPGCKEAALVLADLRFLKRDLEGAKRSLQSLLETHPSDPDGLYMMGIVLFNQHDFDGAQNFLERSAGIHRYASNFLKDLAQVYAQNGKLGQAIETLDRVLELSPADDSARSLRSNLQERQSLIDTGVRRQDGPFRLLLPANLTEPVYKRILGYFKAAYDDLCETLGYYPSQVDVMVFERTGNLLPAFYSHISDEIIISAEYFSAIDSERKEKLGRHLIYHEFSHLVLFQALERPAFSPLSLWLMEGLAEHQAGGYDYTSVDYPKTFAPGLLGFTDLADYLPVSAVGTGRKREKAYIQAYLMVDYLLKQSDGMNRLKEMVRGYAAGSSDRDVLASAGWPSPTAFLEAVSLHIRDNFYR